jgi:small subunit ribosomal protein S9
LVTGTQKPVTGRRKEAVARVRLLAGSGQHRVNGKTLNEYFPRLTHRRHVQEPIAVSNTEGQLDIVAIVAGGGVTGQAGALRLGIARALCLRDETLRPTLKKHGMLTRDARMTERKKYGRPKARKRFQFSKR